MMQFSQRVFSERCICGHAAVSHIASEGLCTECQCMGFKLSLSANDDVHVQELQNYSGVNDEG